MSDRFWNIPNIWVDKTTICIACGPSLTSEDIDYCEERKDKIKVIVVNNAYEITPWANILYAADKAWWEAHKGVESFKGLRVGIQSGTNKVFPGIKMVKITGNDGLETHDRSGLRTGMNSGYQAINLAVQLGSKKIILLGYDMSPNSDGVHHFFGDHKFTNKEPVYEKFLQRYPTLVKPLKEHGVEIINCSRRTVLDCFPLGELRDVLL